MEVAKLTATLPATPPRRKPSTVERLRGVVEYDDLDVAAIVNGQRDEY